MARTGRAAGRQAGDGRKPPPYHAGMNDTPDRLPALPEWPEVLAESEADLAAGRPVPGAAVHQELRDAIARLKAKHGARAEMGGAWPEKTTHGACVQIPQARACLPDKAVYGGLRQADGDSRLFNCVGGIADL